MRTYLRVGLGIALAMGARAAFAEPPTGSRLGDYRQAGPKLTAQDQAMGAKELAKCLYAENKQDSRAALLATSPQIAEASLKRLGGEARCYNLVFANELVAERHAYIPPDIMRGMLAEAALEKARDQVAALQPQPLQQKAYERAWFAMTGRNPSVDEMGACMAETNPAGVATLVSTMPESNEEAAALGAITSDLGKCLRAGMRLEASRQGLRAALAEALFQRVNAPAPTPAAPEATKK